MTPFVQTLVTILCAFLASGGFWALVMKKLERKDVATQVLLGVTHDRIKYLGEQYIERGWLTTDEYTNIHDYLYKPYHTLGGNGTVDRIMEEVKKLEIKPHDHE